MYLTNLKLNNFKTYAELDVDFCSNINCLVGNNGVGKTNLLDAIYYLSFCKSFFGATDKQNVRVQIFLLCMAPIDLSKRVWWFHVSKNVDR